MDNLNQQNPQSIVQAEQSKSNSRLSFLPTLLVGILMLIIGFLGGYLIFSPKMNVPPAGNVNVQPTQPIGMICNPYGVTEISEDFLSTYSSKPGDTPSTILTSQYQNTTRLNEFMILNNFTNSASDSALPEGTKVIMPPKEVTSTSGRLFAVMGQLKRIEDKDYWLKTRTINAEDGDYPIHTNSKTKFIGKPKIGQCVKAVMQLGSPDQIYFITTY